MSGARGRRRGGGGGHGGGHEGPDERWMASYMDMVTVLMCMFIVLYAMSSVDQDKYDALRASLATGFGTQETQTVDASKGVIVPEELLDKSGEGFTELHAKSALREHAALDKLQADIEQALDKVGLDGAATFTIDERGLTVGLVSSDTFFEPNSTRLSTKARRALSAIGRVVAPDSRDLSIEGHADYRRPGGAFPTNWELSASRATGVLRYLVEASGVGSTRVQSVGFGSSRPIAKGSSYQALAQNRRVDIVVLSDADEATRALLPKIEKLQQAEH
ncbi:flagellar motor protein MotB [Microbacterium sp. 77mftsu3.1]|uniref:OmpA/MotB family protein n=1 Tax=Microbacterium sp. 77mftsu3.1 TaxID=1761802 RepID=UPI00088BB2C3|nr:flagellar motor protein MotB [Microbacterium sp. 77mftsu3.1]SDH36268.1 chemotaxis protein MotB [Microbacterium sp. 77mftsu3.1]